MAGRLRGKALNKQREFATLYVNGPDNLRGNWKACETHLGRDFTIIEVRDYIIAEGGIPPMPSDLGSKLASDVVEYVPENDEQLPDVDFTDVAAKMASARTDDDWRKLAEIIQPTAVAIMSGGIKGSAAQTSLIKTVWDRAYGKTSTKEQSEKDELGILILPVLGGRAEMKVCPRCKYAVEQQSKEVKDADI